MTKDIHGSTALETQIGGDHYKSGIQPFQISMANGHDACTHAMNKYVTRHRRKPPEKGYEDLKKAHHIAAIRLELMTLYGVHHPPHKPLIGIADYVTSNKLAAPDAAAVYAIEAWHERMHCDHQRWHDHIRSLIRKAALAAYPDTYSEKDFA